MSRRILRSVGGLTLLGVMACGDPTAPTLPGRTPLIPPAEYRTWWDRIERCSSTSGDFERVDWYRIESFPDQVTLVGQWNSNREITIREDRISSEEVVSHEILHDLLDGDSQHTDIAWSRCGLPVGIGG